MILSHIAYLADEWQRGVENLAVLEKGTFGYELCDLGCAIIALKIDLWSALLPKKIREGIERRDKGA